MESALLHTARDGFESRDPHQGQVMSADLRSSLIRGRFVTQDTLYKWGLTLWKRTYSKDMSELEAEDEICSYLAELFQVDPSTLLKVIDLSVLGESLFAARWVDCACPQVVLPHTYAAALMSTSVAQCMVSDIEPPWGAFVIKVPENLLYVRCPILESNITIDVICILRMRREDKWTYFTLSKSPVSLWRFNVGLDDLLAGTIENNPYEDHPLALPFDSQDERVSVLIGRLIVNTIFAVRSAENVRKIGQGHKEYRKPNRNKINPAYRTFRVGKPIKLDCREAISNYIERGSTRVVGSPTAAWLVRGHLRNQRYGKNLSRVKRIWVEPYWKGNGKGVVLIRSHEFTESEVHPDNLPG